MKIKFNPTVILFYLLIILLYIGYIYLCANAFKIREEIDPAYRGTISPIHFNTTLDFKWVGNLPIINVEIKGKSYKFLFDTAAPTMLSKKLIQDLELSPITNIELLHDSSGKQLHASLYTLPSLKVNEVEFKDFTILSNNFATTFPLSCFNLDGVLGYNYFQYMVVKLDMKNQKIILSDTLMNHKDYLPINIEFEPRHGPLINLDFAFGNALFEIDTGNNSDIQIGSISVIPDMEKLKYYSREVNGAFVAGFGGVENNNRKLEYVVKDFSIDNIIPIKSFPVSVNQSNAFLIGEDFLKKFTIIIDFPAKKAYFKQVEEGEISEGFHRTFGFTPIWDGKSSLIIGAITSNTPATKANLKLGDKIISLNGMKMNKVTEDEFCKFMLSSQSNPNSFEKQKSIKLVIQRKIQTVEEIQLFNLDKQ